MRGVARSFWIVVSIVAAVEIFIGILAVRSVQTDLTCWISGLRDHGFENATCGASVGIVGFRDWIPATAILLLFAATVLSGLGTLIVQDVRTRTALRHLGPEIPKPSVLRRIESALGIRIRLCDDDRCFCCCAGLVSPRVIISRGMLDLLDEPELTAVLAHEAAHVRHRDPARALAVKCAANALFYLPVVRQLSQKALVASELGADSAATVVAGRTALVGALLDVLGRVRPALGSVTEMASLDSLDLRIEALRTRALPRIRPSAFVLVTSATVVVGLLLLAFWLPDPVNNLIVHPAHHITRIFPN